MHTFQVSHIEKQETEDKISEYEEIMVVTVTKVSRADGATHKGNPMKTVAINRSVLFQQLIRI